MEIRVRSALDLSLIAQEGRCIPIECYNPDQTSWGVDGIDDFECRLVEMFTETQLSVGTSAECCYADFEDEQVREYLDQIFPP